MIRIGINGFGRIGRAFLRKVIDNPAFKVVAINDPAQTEVLLHLLKYDSVHGKFGIPFSQNADAVKIASHEIVFYHLDSPALIPWDETDTDVVIEASGKFLTAGEVHQSFSRGVKKIIFTAPPKDSTKTIVMGVNEHTILSSDHVLSNASCTTNNVAPMLKVIHERMGIESAFITTVHSYTSDQRLIDSPHADLRRGRAAALSIIPTTTGAAKAVTRIFPEFEGKIVGGGIRVPVPDGSLTDLTCIVKRQLTVEEINHAFELASTSTLKGIIEYVTDPIVSSDVLGNTHSCLFDSGLTSVVGNMVKVVGWYDNEIGYASRLIDLVQYLQKHQWLN
ncbi:MAG: type I glyceraldehyde-3-phosphate dehydrogenase [Bacteroidota bacterium]